MPSADRDTIIFNLTDLGVWVLLEEVWKEGFWVDNDRKLRVPTGMNVSFRHNFMWPFWHWEVGLNDGLHTFFIADGWNKFQVRLNSLSPGTSGSTVQWLL
jgi:hypothetical protein